MRITIQTMKKDAIIYADSEQMNGFAIWLPFGFTGSKTIPFLTNGGLRLILRCGLKIVKRLISYESFAMNLKNELTEHYDWYLYNISIRQEAQGKGIARALLQPMLDFCDREGMTAYLETNKEKNVSLYQHFGFRLKKEKMIPKSEVVHYAMVRQAMQTKD